jgi:hypothetical protein
MGDQREAIPLAPSPPAPEALQLFPWSEGPACVGRKVWLCCNTFTEYPKECLSSLAAHSSSLQYHDAAHAYARHST